MTVEYPQERAERTLDELPSDAPAEQIATAIADLLLTRGPPPFKLGIKFDGTQAPCPVRVDKQAREWCTILLQRTDEARKWIVQAALTGLTVARAMSTRGAFGLAELHSESIAHVRDRKRVRDKWAAHRVKVARAVTGNTELDDTIPF